MKQDRDFLHDQLIKLGDMMGDGLHHEPGGRWISREYNKICRILYPDMMPKKDFTKRNKAVEKWCSLHQCSQCNGKLRQTRSGSMRVICLDCGTKYQLSKSK
ncbi:hypothetical protein M2451_002543 [Dysgonomonas sp. PFB1-18]|nr:hypothetical protein [Dysgonomonas sp. PF1-14]MDH6339563.1 hypothetical protein [Dysgonomonas sp. PF1-16]MDH6381214.1 hypothetical protein [Dysgonomonas sp. PFB1-18]MDH6398426.1 hypothetical protein [Dysgonomonas sp. PF1-23]